MLVISLVLVVITLGILLWLANTFVPMDGWTKILLNVLVMIVIALWLVQVFSSIGPLITVKIQSR